MEGLRREPRAVLVEQAEDQGSGRMNPDYGQDQPLAKSQWRSVQRRCFAGV